MTGIIRTILIIWLVYYLMRLVFRFVIPWLLTKYVKHVQNQVFSQQGNSSPKSPPPGEITVEQTQQSSKAFNSQDGEYVDYEEIK